MLKKASERKIQLIKEDINSCGIETKILAQVVASPLDLGAGCQLVQVRVPQPDQEAGFRLDQEVECRPDRVVVYQLDQGEDYQPDLEAAFRLDQVGVFLPVLAEVSQQVLVAGCPQDQRRT